MKNHADKKNRHHRLAIVIMGFTALVVQILLMRELTVQFYGNELSLGTILGIWLLWTALGSGLLARMIKIADIRRAAAFVQLTLAGFLIPFILIIRSGKAVLSVTIGEMIGFMPMLLISAITLAPFCLLSGMLYTWFCRFLQPFGKVDVSSISCVFFMQLCLYLTNSHHGRVDAYRDL